MHILKIQAPELIISSCYVFKYEIFHLNWILLPYIRLESLCLNQKYVNIVGTYHHILIHSFVLLLATALTWTHALDHCLRMPESLKYSNRHSTIIHTLRWNEVFVIKLKNHYFYLLWFSTPLSFFLDCFSFHATIQTFLVTTILTTIPLLLINYTVSFLPTRVWQIFADCALKKSFTSLTTAKICEKLVWE